MTLSKDALTAGLHTARLKHIRASYEASKQGNAFIGHPSYDEQIAIIDALLAAEAQEPVAVLVQRLRGYEKPTFICHLLIDEGNGEVEEGSELYAAQPAPVESAAQPAIDLWNRWADAEDKITTRAPAAQPVQVPDAIEPTYEAIKAILPTANPDEYACCVGADMWNACRAAMLKGNKDA